MRTRGGVDQHSRGAGARRPAPRTTRSRRSRASASCDTTSRERPASPGRRAGRGAAFISCGG